MIILNRFNNNHITSRPVSMFATDIEAKKFMGLLRLYSPKHNGQGGHPREYHGRLGNVI